jgi:ATP-dependent Clp protease adaptor protein ClpS
MPSTDTITKRETKTAIRKPSMFKVIFNNDDKTPMDFVIEILMRVFHHDEKSATAVTMEVHEKGKGVAGLYTFEIAEQKATETVAAARAFGFPLTVTVEVE